MNDILVVVLNDGETYTNIEGCVILNIPANVPDHEADMFVKDNAYEGGIPLAPLKRFLFELKETKEQTNLD